VLVDVTCCRRHLEYCRAASSLLAGKILDAPVEPPHMRAKLDTDTLLSIVLVLVVVWLVLEIVSEFLSILGTALVVVPNLIGLAIIAVIVLWWFDYL
jgi:hypothetical protein